MPIASTRNHRDEREALLPPALVPLFDERFIASCDLLEDYVDRLVAGLARSMGLEAACREPASVDAAVARAGLLPEVATEPLAWALAMLAARGWVAASSAPDGSLRYQVREPLPALPPDEVLQAQEALDPRCLPSYRIAALAAEQYPAVLRGQLSGEQALFGPEGVSAWVKYFSNANPLYAISNAVGAIAAAQAFPAGSGAILEIGGGLGSGAEALLDRLAAIGRLAHVEAYQFTEISPLFLKRAQRTLAARYPQVAFSFQPLDIDGPLQAGNVAPGSCALVYGVNVLHVARDLGATLAELRQALRGDGVLVMAECVRPFAGRPLHLELVFNLLPSFRDVVRVPGWRPNGGFLAPEQWTAALQANGFAAVEVYPDIAALRDAYPGFTVAAIVARRG
jgi:SAM-dependent methyltransferase